MQSEGRDLDAEAERLVACHFYVKHTDKVFVLRGRYKKMHAALCVILAGKFRRQETLALFESMHVPEPWTAIAEARAQRREAQALLDRHDRCAWNAREFDADEMIAVRTVLRSLLGESCMYRARRARKPLLPSDAAEAATPQTGNRLVPLTQLLQQPPDTGEDTFEGIVSEEPLCGHYAF